MYKNEYVKIKPAQLPELLADDTIYLVGNTGGFSLINGEVYPSNISVGTMVIETEHGSTYVPIDKELLISKEPS